MRDNFTVIAIIAAYNEADIIESVVNDLIVQGTQVYLIDHQSTDGTADQVAPFLGRGLLGVERFPDASGLLENGNSFAWANILQRKARLAQELDADWYIHHDADEFRESPWPHLDLVEGIQLVDRLGYNAIDFELFDFWPTGETYEPGQDVRDVLRWFEPARTWNKHQIRCWKHLDTAVDLASSGGHEIEFPGRRVFPVRFLLRHYPIRGQSHGERKVLAERQGRFLEAERARGWHVQYDGIDAGHTFIRSRSELVEYDPDAARLSVLLHHRGVEELEAKLAATLDLLEDRTRVLDDRVKDLAVLTAQTTERGMRLEALSGHLDALDRQIESQAAITARQVEEARHTHQAEIEALGRIHRSEIEALSRAHQSEIQAYRARIRDLESQIEALQATVQEIYASRTWRAATFLRRIVRPFKS